jgi:hypothetical protein
MNPRVSFERVGLSAFDSTHSMSLVDSLMEAGGEALQLLDAQNLNHGHQRSRSAHPRRQQSGSDWPTRPGASASGEPDKAGTSARPGWARFMAAMIMQA